MEDKKAKQNYLFKEIIEKNYDPEQFQERLIESKTGGDDLDNWTLAELELFVTRFQQLANKGSVSQGVIDLPLSSSAANEVQDDKVNKMQIVEKFIEDNQHAEQGQKYLVTQYHFDYSNQNEAFSQIITCQTTSPNSLLAREVQVKVTRFEKKEGGLFEQSYVSYFVHTTCLGKTVERRYSDFEWLKTTLSALHPGLPIPPIAKKGQFRRYDDKHLLKRMMILEMFLKRLLQIPQTKTELLLQNFLQLQDRVTFQKFKSSFKKDNKILQLKQIKNIKGKVTIGFDTQINAFLVKSQQYFSDTQPQVKRIYKQFKAAATALQTCSGVLSGLATLCSDLDDKDSSYRKATELFYCPNNFYTILSQTSRRLAVQIDRQAQLFRKQLYAMTKYESLYMVNILDEFYSLASFQQQYQSARSNLYKKKVKLFEEGNMTKWGLKEVPVKKPQLNEAIDLMLPTQTMKLGKMREMYAMFNFQMFEQLNRYCSTKNYHMGKSLQEVCRKHTQICSQMMMIWVDTETSIMSLKENKFLQRC